MSGEVPMIRLSDIEKVYRTDKIETVALANVNLDVAPGEFVSIMGPSGCGKSTLLHVMGLLDAPTRGTVALDGRVVDSFDDRRLAPLRNKEIGFIFQTFHLIPDLSVVDNVEIPLLYRRMIESILGRASANQYGYAVRDVRNCESLAGQLPEDAGIEGHDAFMARLRKEHGRKSKFWELVHEGA